MKQLILIFFIIISANASSAQIKALTESGREVSLFDNGTWRYLNDSSSAISENEPLATNAHNFFRTPAATFPVKSQILNVGVYINPAKWTVSTHKENKKNPEYRFSYKTGEGYGIMVTEKTQISLENMPDIALRNAQKASADARIISQEYRVVNKKKVLCLQIEGTVTGIKFIYLAYYYSNSNGTVQLISYTSKQFFAGLQKEFETFLNGFIEFDK